MHLGDDLAVGAQHQAQHAVRAGMLRAHVDEHLVGADVELDDGLVFTDRGFGGGGHELVAFWYVAKVQFAGRVKYANDPDSFSVETMNNPVAFENDFADIWYPEFLYNPARQGKYLSSLADFFRSLTYFRAAFGLSRAMTLSAS